jgi:hypothetical protein
VQFLIQLTHSGFVVAGMAEEDAERAGGHKDEGGMMEDEFWVVSP